ncbi:mRNA-capping enzyme [Fistulifera solaris]|jgi:hypothetical protein|uniref:mRNA 5'-phosphatase n=1 Tax=Fistulifera solaris TaxID=1519565 RepID=A0A1Z5JPL9_FISSO|nr:mRNA-capping enzyme [Fistulifera solaris]|eukprot:GAX15721.1 mRNA-capping enzyme [Fistulifera solaris]
MSKRPNFDINAFITKRAKLDEETSTAPQHGNAPKNIYLSTPVHPEQSLQIFLTQVRNAARKYNPAQTIPISKPFCEVEARLGILKVPHSVPPRRVTSTGAKHVNGNLVKAFECSHQNPRCQMVSGVSRTHFSKWTASGLSELSPLAYALGVTAERGDLKQDLEEKEYVETVYSGYPNDRRVCYPGLHGSSHKPLVGIMESKEKLVTMDLTIPAANYDLRIALASETIVDPAVPNDPPPGWSVMRIKRRRSYTRRDRSIAWQIDVTEVTTTSRSTPTTTEVDFEIEVELQEKVLLQLINEENEENSKKMTHQLSQQLWWIMSQINPLVDALNVEEMLRDHPDKHAVQLALAQCGALKKFMDARGTSRFESPIERPNDTPSAALSNIKFPGCMPVNFSRHNIDEIQRGANDAYYISEKTDGVRHFLVFTGKTAVLVDRAMKAKQPIPTKADQDPFGHIIDLIKPGTVFDGEVVMNRRGRKPRPIFIVFDVMSISTTEPVLQLPFDRRLDHLRKASFRTPTANRDMFDPRYVADPAIPLPLVRKNFVKRTEVDELLSNVVEERGMRCYHKGDLHFHLTDGIIFQPNRPYVCGTDVHLLKWKYLDTVTIDVELLPLLHNDDDDTLRVGCLGEEQTRVDMTRHILLPLSERMRLEADRFESGDRIAEVGFDPETGEWYYLTMRSDKVAPNHISTVLGALLELGECLTSDELRYRMSVPAGSRDTYRKDMRGMLKQLLSHQRRRLQAQK